MYYVYIMTNWTGTTLYTGVTRDLQGRVHEHKNKIKLGFTAKYNVKKLAYYEEFASSYEAIQREKQIKGGSRKKKEDLINSTNPLWNDLSKEWY